MSRSLVSVIVPCYNHGAFIDEALRSVARSEGVEVEIIIVNDGSTDAATLRKLQQLSAQGYRVIHQSNGGPSAARNNGISQAAGTYILPLDSDNRLEENFLRTAVALLDQQPHLDIVYGDSYSIGTKEGRNSVGPFDLNSMLRYNSIDTCALYRKTVWQAVGGYDANMPHAGHEDWAFWLHAYLLGKRFHYLEQVCFYYRWLPGSVSSVHTPAIVAENRKYLYDRHYPKIIELLLREHRELTVEKEYLLKQKPKAIVKLLFNLPFVRHVE